MIAKVSLKSRGEACRYHSRMGFRVAHKTLERLEWPRVLERVRDQCRTPRARARVAAAMREDESETLFAPTLLETRRLLAMTSEARALLDKGEPAPLAGVAVLDDVLGRAARGATLAASELVEIGSTLSSLHGARRYLSKRSGAAPTLGELSEQLEEQPELAARLERCLDPSGEVRDSASRALADARREAARLGGDLQSRLDRYVRNSDLRNALTDDYYTVRGDRYVLPVRADSRAKVPGIVHDASNSGTTLFIEPQAVVDLNNRLKQCELTVLREVRRILHELSGAVMEVLPSLDHSLDVLSEIDLAFARGTVSVHMEASAPVVERGAVFDLKQLRHPLLSPEEAVANDLRLGDPFRVLVLSGPNAGGKTVAMKAVALAALLARAGMHVPADPGASVPFVDTVLADIGDEQDIRESLSTFSAHMLNLAIVVKAATPESLVVLDEIGVGTDPGEGSALAQSILEGLADIGASVITTTHYNLLKEMAEVDPRFCNASVDFDPDTLAPTYRLRIGAAGSSSATAVASRMGMPGSVLERANKLLDREDRRLDRMLAELSASRATLEREQTEVAALRAENEATRDRYRGKLERLQERRDELFHSMRADLDRAFTDAHGQVAAVIRDLQRGGTAQDAAHARKRLLSLKEETKKAERKSGLQPKPEERLHPVDWRHATAGLEVVVAGSKHGKLVSLPDRRGRVRVQVGTATLVIAADSVRSSSAVPRAPEPSEPRTRVHVTGAVDPARTGHVGGGIVRCDLRGMRVREALDRVLETLDRATAEGRDSAFFIHGHGTGALRNAVREALAQSHYVSEIRPGEDNEGGEGVTHAEIR